MLEIGIQTRNIIQDDNPSTGFQLLKSAGFSCVDFSLNAYLHNKAIYKGNIKGLFDKSEEELEAFFTPHKKAAKEAGIRVHQMHMPYPIYVPNGKREVNDYLWNIIAVKSLKICKFFNCKYIVVHGFKLAKILGSEELEWQKTEEFLDSIAPMAKEMGITLCIENLYHNIGNHMEEGPCCDAKKAIKRIDRMNEKYDAEVLGFCLDVGHANLVGIDIYDFIVTLGHRLKVLHMHDNDGIADLHQLPYAFTKNSASKHSVDWEGFISGLKAIGFEGVLNFEASPAVMAFPKELREDALAFLVKIGQVFSNKINM